jgi:hypothetical protein
MFFHCWPSLFSALPLHLNLQTLACLIASKSNRRAVHRNHHAVLQHQPAVHRNLSAVHQHLPAVHRSPSAANQIHAASLSANYSLDDCCKNYAAAANQRIAVRQNQPAVLLLLQAVVHRLQHHAAVDNTTSG